MSIIFIVDNCKYYSCYTWIQDTAVDVLEHLGPFVLEFGASQFNKSGLDYLIFCRFQVGSFEEFLNAKPVASKLTTCCCNV